MNNFCPLPFQAPIYESEGLMGYVLRMSNKNGVAGIHWLYQKLGREKLNHLKPEDTIELATLFGAEIRALDRAMPKPKRIDGLRVFDLHSQRVNKSYLIRPSRPQLCPHCIAEFGYVRSEWDFSMFCVCPLHKCVLIDACSRCGKLIQWMRPLLHACNCGALWTESHSAQYLPTDMRISIASLISRKLKRSTVSVDGSMSSLEVALSSLSIDTLSRTIWALGIKANHKSTIPTGTSRIILRTNEANSYCKRGYERLVKILNAEVVAEKIQQEIHLPSLILLSKEASSNQDMIFIELILKKVDPLAFNKKSIQVVFRQLPLF